MNRRIIWGGIAAVIFAAAYITSGYPGNKVLPLILAALCTIAVYQVIWNFDSAGAAFQKLSGGGTTTTGQRILGVLSLVFGFMFISGPIFTRGRAVDIAEMKNKGIVTEAIVEDGWSTKRRRSGTSYTLKLKYKDQNGQEQVVEEGVDGREFEQVAIGMPVEIIYVPGNPALLDVLLDADTKAQYGK